MKISATVSLIVLAIPIQLFSQTLKKGYIINAQNDTISGFIKEHPDEELARFVSFSKENDASQLVKYTSLLLNGFGFSNGRVFEKISLKEFDGKDSVVNHYFAKRILTGKIYAYTIESAGKETQWLLKNQITGKIVHLKKPREHEVKTAEGRIAYAPDFKYLQYVTMVKQDSPNTYVKQDDFKYSKKQVIKNIKAYNSAYKETYPVHQYKDQTQITYGILGGFFLYSPKHASNEHTGYSNTYRISGFRDVTWFEKISRISFTQGFSYSHFNESTFIEYPYNNPLLDISYQTINEILSIYPAGVKFQGYSKPVMPYVYTGLGITFIKYDKIERMIRIDNIKSLTVGINIGAGLKIKLTSHWLIMGEVSHKFVEGFYANAGFAYQYIKQK